jgi:hypothetical protein
VLKARVTFNREKWRWQVWEAEAGQLPLHHSYHRTKAEALAVAREQNMINKREAGLPCPSR